MSFKAGILVAPLLLAACGSDHGEHRAARLLDGRLHDRMAAYIAAGQASLQVLPDGARVVFLDPSVFPTDNGTLDDSHATARASLIEGLLDPSLLQIAVNDTSTLPDEQREARVHNIIAYLQDFGLGGTIVQAPPAGSAPAAGAAPPSGLVVTIRLNCPAHVPAPGDSSGHPQPTCY